MNSRFAPEQNLPLTAAQQADIDSLGASRRDYRIGLIVPASNTNAEPDCALLAPAGVTLHISRSGGYDVNAIPDSAEMRRFVRSDLDNQLQLLSDARVDLIAYACTSATLSDGPEFDRQFCADIERISERPALTTAGALVDAIQALELEKVAFTSPYVQLLAQESIDFIQQCGTQVVSHASFSQSLNSIEQGALTPADAYRMALLADHPEAQGIVISCTDYRALEALPSIEQALGKPVICSNQALMYACLKRLGLQGFTPSIYGGELFKRAFVDG